MPRGKVLLGFGEKNNPSCHLNITFSSFQTTSKHFKANRMKVYECINIDNTFITSIFDAHSNPRQQNDSNYLGI